VLAFHRGSVPEVVADGETGFIAGSLDEMVAAADRLAEIDRRAHRRRAEKPSSIGAMTDGYERAYEALPARAQSPNRLALVG
jgi:hypothetical protein